MAKTVNILQVFVASPGDVSVERNLLDEIVTEFNNTWGDTHKARLELVKWETHTRPGFGEDGQDVINTQIGENFDILIGIMWGRFGSPTNRAESGTEEEFRRAYSRMKKSPESVQILFYFKNAGIPPNTMDLDQLAKVKAFRRMIESECGALYHSFETPDEFRNKVRMHLSKAVQDRLSSLVNLSSPSRVTVPSSATDKTDPLAHLKELDNDDCQEGLIDVSERATDAIGRATMVLNNIQKATFILGKRFEQRTQEINKAKSGDPIQHLKAIKRITNSTADNLEKFVSEMAIQIPSLNEQYSIAMDAFGKIAMCSDPSSNASDFRDALEVFEANQGIVQSTSESVSGFRQVVDRLPNATTKFNRARRRAVAVLDDLICQFRVIASQSHDVEQLLRRILGGSSD